MKILIRNHKSEKWQLVQSAAYANEGELQKLLAEQPSLVSVNEAREGAGTLVAAVRELQLGIGSIDLVGFTADGDIAVIECKLATNAEIKRKVIGQVFEYGVGLWGMSYEELDQKILQRTNQNLAECYRPALESPLRLLRCTDDDSKWPQRCGGRPTLSPGVSVTTTPPIMVWHFAGCATGPLMRD